jgi:hypothetical protein
VAELDEITERRDLKRKEYEELRKKTVISNQIKSNQIKSIQEKDPKRVTFLTCRI